MLQIIKHAKTNKGNNKDNVYIKVPAANIY